MTSEANVPEAKLALNDIGQMIIEVRHAQQQGPWWYTNGQPALIAQVERWLKKADAALPIIIDALDRASRPTPRALSVELGEPNTRRAVQLADKLISQGFSEPDDDLAVLSKAVIDLSDALAAPQVGVTGRSMDTAPKDGTEVLLRVKMRAGIPGRFLVGHYLPGGHPIEDHPPIAAGWYFWNGLMFDKAAKPLEWWPLSALAASPSTPVTVPEGMVRHPLNGSELWEILFSTMKGDVPADLTDSVLEEVAAAIREAFL